VNKILVTGGAGFIGHRFVNFIIENTNADVVVVDNLYNGDFNRITKNDRVTLLNCSVCEIEKYSKYIDECDYIFHMACVQISKSSNVPHVDLETNAISTLNILEYLKNHKTPLKRFVYTSSCSIYGQSEYLPVDEKTPPNISSIYAATKYLGENYTNLYHKLFKIPVSIVRYSNVYGPGQTPEDKICGVIGKFIYQSLNNETLSVFGDGSHTRDYSYLDDVVEATYIVSNSEKCLGQTYNVSTNTNISVNKIIRIIESNIDNVKTNYSEPRIIDNIHDRLISFDKLNNHTGWRPTHSIELGIKKTIEYFKHK
jgi:UDP-glucose 4-epimerase